MYEDIIRDVLRTVLSSGSVLGARLRPLLIEEFRRATTRDLEPFLRAFGKFSVFLAANADLVNVRSDDKSGDIRVSLKTGEAPQGPTLRLRRRFSRELWQAFTNPDERRRRFYHRDTREVVHYLQGSSEELDKSFAQRVSSDHKFVEIQFAHAHDQNMWMKEFLDSTSGLSDSTRRVATHLVSVPYESSVSLAFASALGAYAEAWRRYRASKVSDKVEQWAERNSVPLQTEVPHSATETSVASPSETGLPVAAKFDAEELRGTLQSAIMLMNATELAQVLIPATVCARLSHARAGD